MKSRRVYQHLERKTPFGRWALPDWFAVLGSAAAGIPIAMMLPIAFRWQLCVVALVLAPAITVAELRDSTGGKPGWWLRARANGLMRARRGRAGMPASGRERGHAVAAPPPPPPALAASSGSDPVELFQ